MEKDITKPTGITKEEIALVNFANNMDIHEAKQIMKANLVKKKRLFDNRDADCLLYHLDFYKRK
jgi:hypothetical protein